MKSVYICFSTDILHNGHLNILKNAGLVTDERRGQNIVYCLNLTVFQEAVKWFFDFGFVKGGPDDETK